jgi:hypothetical protein
MGGAMSDSDEVVGAEVNSDLERVNAGVMRGEVLGPKKSRVRKPSGAAVVQKMALGTVEEEMRGILDCVVVNIKAGHLPSAKFIFELASKMKRSEEVDEAEMQSFAELLIKSLEAETMPGAGADAGADAGANAGANAGAGVVSVDV